MRYLLGGASRAGKSTLARRLLRERGVPYFPLDYLLLGLENGVPSLGVTPGNPAVVGEQLWPLVRAMAKNLQGPRVDLRRRPSPAVSLHEEGGSRCGYGRGVAVAANIGKTCAA
jgi:hypothetical protein